MDIISRRFAWFHAWSQLKLKYRHTLLGFVWNLLEPAMFLGVLSLVFSVVNDMKLGDYAVFLFAALVPWRYFERVVTSCMESIAGGDWVLKKLHVSPLALPFSRWIMASYEFLFSLVVAAIFFAFFKSSWTPHMAILPLSIIPWSLFGLGIGLMCAVLFTFFRDIRPLVQMALMLAFFSSPILFRSDLFEQHSIQDYMVRLHPFTYFAALFQKPIYYAAWPAYEDWMVTSVLSVLSLLSGYFLVRQYRSRFYFYL